MLLPFVLPQDTYSCTLGSGEEWELTKCRRNVKVQGVRRYSHYTLWCHFKSFLSGCLSESLGY